MDISANPHSDFVPPLQLLDTSEREAPITTLPPELICEIFAWTLPVKTYMKEESRWRLPLCAQLKGSPWILGHVCQQWRAMALSCPTLWSSITVFVPSTPIYFMPILEAQLHRSADSPLDIFIVAKSTGWRSPNQECLQMLIGCCGRWRSLYTEELEIFDRIRNRLPLLKELVVDPRIPFRAKDKINDTFLNAPSLSKVVLASSYWMPDFIFPWAQLTEYNASFTPLDHFGHLGAAPNLVNCDINILAHDKLYPRRLQDGPQSGQTVTLHVLRRLVVNDDQFLNCLVTPALDELYVIGACDAVQPFLDRSSCVLTRLTLYQCDSYDSITPLLENNPAITTLQIDLSGGAEEMSSLISALTIDAASGGPCLSPNLTSISWAD
ncbi:hypothetical protein C8J57DRAFT_1588571 [Mycena rebaudengoi]|nr:hypothetical protein C8J57DRAFT_1588571 [Mycena rebaudengoi]